MIDVSNLTVGYGRRVLLDGVAAHVAPATLTALIGRNGSGKSTLLRVLAGLGRYGAGRVAIAGQELRSITPQRLARTVAFVNTERVRVANLRVGDVVALGRAPYTNWIGRMQAADEAVVMRSLRLVGMEEHAGRTLDTLSDGERQRAMIARALAQATPVILLDEPTSFLDMPSRYDLAALLSRLAHDEGKCVVYSTHELDIALAHSDSIMLIDNPRLHHMAAGAMAASGLVERTFNLSPHSGRW